ncbi:hypothetical protein TYM08_P1028 [Marinicellulosiphila megalodicopiae]
MNKTNVAVESDQSEFDLADIKSCASNQVNVLSVKDAPIRYECTLRETMSVSELPAGGTVV